MTTSLELLDLVHAAIVTAETDAQDNVFRPGDWPTQDGQYPIIKLRIVGEDRQSLARSGAAQFTTTTTIRLSIEVSAPAKLDDVGATDAEKTLWLLKGQCDAAIVNSYPLMQRIQQILSMRSQLAFNSESATHLAGVQTDLALEHFEGADDFAPLPVSDLDQVELATTNYSPVGFISDFNR